MAIAGKRTIEREKIEQKIDLSEYGLENISEVQKVQLGQALVDTIVERSESQRDVNGKRFPAYSSEYKESEDFERYGKSASDRNMTLRGNLLEGIDSRVENGNITLFIESDQLDKAHGNITGQEGKWGYKRDFFGVRDSEVKKLAKNYETGQQQEDPQETFSTLFLIEDRLREQSARRVFDDLFGSIFNGQS